MSSLTLKKCKKIKELIQEFRDFKVENSLIILSRLKEIRKRGKKLI
ncbi:MAG: hypothetical protein ACQESN_10880 [Thermotogota bacterium]